MKEEWKIKLQDSLADFEEAAPEGLWAAIEETMDEKVMPLPTKEESLVTAAKPNVLRSNGRTRMLRLFAAAAGVACLAGIFVYFADKDKAESPVVANLHTDKGTGNVSDEIEKGREELRESAEIQGNSAKEESQGNVSVHNRQSEKLLAQIPETDNEGVRVNKNQKSSLDNNSSVSEDGLGKKDEKKESTGYVKHSCSDNQAVMPLDACYDVDLSHPKHATTRLTAGLFASNSMASGNSTNVATVFSSSNYLQSDAVFASLPESSDEINTKQYLANTNNDESVKHHAPVRFGISLHYALDKRWGIETGLTYTYLTSDMSCGTRDNRHETNQKLHYVGVPVVVDYNVWNNRWAKFYVAGGGMVEKCVSGKSVSNYILDERLVTSESAKVKPKELQWSVTAAVGAQFNILENLGAYIEPGIGYSFDNGSEVKSAYTEKPFNFNLRVGLRYSIK